VGVGVNVGRVVGVEVGDGVPVGVAVGITVGTRGVAVGDVSPGDIVGSPGVDDGVASAEGPSVAGVPVVTGFKAIVGTIVGAPDAVGLLSRSQEGGVIMSGSIG
jgi:hypothetical protein